MMNDRLRCKTPCRSYRYPYTEEQKRTIQRKVKSLLRAGYDLIDVANIMRTDDKGVFRILSWDVKGD